MTTQHICFCFCWRVFTIVVSSFRNGGKKGLFAGNQMRSLKATNWPIFNLVSFFSFFFKSQIIASVLQMTHILCSTQRALVECSMLREGKTTEKSDIKKKKPASANLLRKSVRPQSSRRTSNEALFGNVIGDLRQYAITFVRTL